MYNTADCLLTGQQLAPILRLLRRSGFARNGGGTKAQTVLTDCLGFLFARDPSPTALTKPAASRTIGSKSEVIDRYSPSGF